MGMRIDDAAARRNRLSAGSANGPLTGGRRSFKDTGSRDPTDRAQVAELVDALASGASGLTAVKVRVLSWAPNALAQTDEMLLGAKRRTAAARRGNFCPVVALRRRILIGAVRMPVRAAAEHAIIAGLHPAAVGGNDRQAHFQ